MTKKLLSLCMAILLFFSQTGALFAETETAVYEKQLRALEQYIDVLYSQMFPERIEALGEAQMRKVIRNGVAFLIESQEENGHFAYEYLPYEDAYLNDDNIVRQAGVLYSLAEVLRRSAEDDAETAKAVEKAISFFADQSPSHTLEGVRLRCITNSNRSDTCKLGATALALTGILGYVEAYPQKTKQYEKLIEEYVAYIVASKKEEGGFRNQYSVTAGFRSDTESSFSNGEALLALARYYKYSPDPQVKKVIDDAFAYLSATPFDSALYLWMMAALKDMHDLWQQEAYVTYAKEYTLWRLASVSSSKHTLRNYCALNEGLSSAYSLLRQNGTEAEKERLRSEIDFWNAKNSLLQISHEDAYRFASENNRYVFKEVLNMKQSNGGFLTAHDVLTQRIDFTQHCITAYAQTLADIDGMKI